MAGESAREVSKRSREKAERLLRHADMYERGAVGEEQTAAVLSALPPGWTVLHDVRWPGRRFANIDHIVIGPAGIFVIDSKNWSGQVLVAGSTLRQNGRSRETTVAACADSALAVSELVPDLADAVVPVICFVRAEPVSGWARDVMVCSTANLVHMLMTRPIQLPPEQMWTAARRLNAQLDEAGRRAPVRTRSPRREVPAGTARSRRQRSSGSRSRRARGGSLPRLIVSLTLLLGFVMVGPQLATAFSKVFVHVFTSNFENSSCSDSSVSPSTTEKRSRRPASDAGGRPTANKSDRQLESRNTGTSVC